MPANLSSTDNQHQGPNQTFNPSPNQTFNPSPNQTSNPHPNQTSNPNKPHQTPMSTPNPSMARSSEASAPALTHGESSSAETMGTTRKEERFPLGGQGAGAPTSAAVELKRLASSVADEVKKTAQNELAPRKGQVADELRGVAHALRSAASSSEARVADRIRPYVERAAQQVDNASEYVNQKTLSEMLDDATKFARSEPALFLGGVFLVGLLGGRFLKSSTPRAVEPPTFRGRAAPEHS